MMKTAAIGSVQFYPASPLFLLCTQVQQQARVLKISSQQHLRLSYYVYILNNCTELFYYNAYITTQIMNYQSHDFAWSCDLHFYLQYGIKGPGGIRET